MQLYSLLTRDLSMATASPECPVSLHGRRLSRIIILIIVSTFKISGHVLYTSPT